MKNLLLVLFVICALFSCKQNPTVATVSALDTTRSPGPDSIPLKLAKAMVGNYGVHVGNLQNSTGTVISNESNTSTIWLDLKKLNALVKKLNDEQKAGRKTDGVRIYFATYGDNVADDAVYRIGLQKDYSYRNSVVLISTRDSMLKGDTSHYHWDYFTNNKAATFFTGPANKGELCPPPTKCCTIGAELTCP